MHKYMYVKRAPDGYATVLFQKNLSVQSGYRAKGLGVKLVYIFKRESSAAYHNNYALFLIKIAQYSTLYDDVGNQSDHPLSDYAYSQTLHNGTYGDKECTYEHT